MGFPTASHLGSTPPLKGSLLLIDLQGYSEKITVTSDIIGEGAAALLQTRIQNYWLSAEPSFNADSGRGWAYRLRQPGDGALYLFEHACDAEAFAAEVCKNAQNRNQGVADDKWHHLFRAGIATGEIEWTPSGGEWVWCGRTANRPSRLEASARTGEIVIDRETYDSLPMEIQAKYNGPESVEVKGETYEVYRRPVDLAAVEAHKLRHLKAVEKPRQELEDRLAIRQMSEQLDELRNRSDLARLEAEWEKEQEQFFGYPRSELPGIFFAVGGGGVTLLISILFFNIHVCMGIIPLLVGIIFVGNGIQMVSKANSYTEALAKYQDRKRQLEERVRSNVSLVTKVDKS